MKEEKNIHFIDCGGNIGQATQWVLNKYDVYKIDVFEPFSYNFEILKKNVNNTKVFLHNKAVWINDGIIDFYLQDYGKRVGSSLIKGKVNTSKIPVKVKSINLSKWLIKNVKNNTYNILKLDVEGAEYDLLPHLFKNNIDKLIDEWFIEFHGRKTPNYKKSIEDDFYARNLKYRDWSFCE